jgi:tetratricopeptide (TPR) repeat protein
MLRAFVGASEDGRYACAEIQTFDDRPGRSVMAVEPAGALSAKVVETPLAPELARAALQRAAAAGETPERTAEASLANVLVEGFDPARAKLLKAGNATSLWDLAEWAGLPAQLELRREKGELRLFVRLTGADQEIAVFRFHPAGEGWISGVLLLPGGRRVLALTGSASSSRTELHRLEGLSEVGVGAALSALLDDRAVRHIEAGALEEARADLSRAIALAPEDAAAHYNLACALALSNEGDAALLELGRAVDLEPERFKQLAPQDPDLAALRERVEFRLMVEPRLP